MSGRDVRIAIAEGTDRSPRQLLKVLGYGDDGFGVTMPYHAVRSGYAGKIPVDYSKREQSVSRAEMKMFDAANRVKLSYHSDGFVQFSSEQRGTIKSGRDPQSGEPKGVGIMIQPLSRPLRGPTCGVTLWGLDEFEELRPGREASVFGPDDVYDRHCAPDDANAWTVELFAFPKHWWSGVRRRGGEFVLAISRRDFEVPGAVLEFRVIDIDCADAMLAVLVSRARVAFGCPSGWTLAGPSQLVTRTTGEMLIACYPKEAAALLTGGSIDWPESSGDTGRAG